MFVDEIIFKNLLEDVFNYFRKERAPFLGFVEKTNQLANVWYARNLPTPDPGELTVHTNSLDKGLPR